MIALDSNIYASIIVRDEFYDKCLELVRTHVTTGIATVDLAFVEAANALWKSVSVLKRIPPDEAEPRVEALKRLLRKTSTIHTSEELLDEAVRVATQHDITVYDALYIALARKLDVRLASTDENLYQKLRDTTLKDTVLLIK
ncbi:MAG: type II toxin-antitoxin system VapC family toxin [Candidatus Bathyarchaeia archaeon]